MKLRLVRTELTPDYTTGALYVDGAFECYTLEDTVREPGVKVHGQTAIPAGTYKVIINMSARFKRLLPLLLNVPGFEGVRIHPGNSAANTEGCVLVGRKKSPGWLGESVLAFEPLFARLQAAARKGEDIELEIS